MWTYISPFCSYQTASLALRADIAPNLQPHRAASPRPRGPLGSDWDRSSRLPWTPSLVATRHRPGFCCPEDRRSPPARNASPRVSVTIPPRRCPPPPPTSLSERRTCSACCRRVSPPRLVSAAPPARSSNWTGQHPPLRNWGSTASSGTKSDGIFVWDWDNGTPRRLAPVENPNQKTLTSRGRRPASWTPTQCKHR